jgi:hypothetical protein
MIERLPLDDETWANLIVLSERDNIFIEGNILKILDPGDSDSHRSYIQRALSQDRTKREKRLEITKQIQASTREVQEKNRELLETQEALKLALEQAESSRAETEKALKDSIEAAYKAERSKKETEQQLDYIHKKKQFELMGDIVRMAIWVVIGVGSVTTIMYAAAVFTQDNDPTNVTLLANTWSNIFGILLTNSFSIIGTIMGVKYATEGSNKNSG